jgi:putative sigma-54 modulation protein
MKIELSGHHIEVTEAMRNQVEDKLSRIINHFPSLTKISVFLTVERKEQSAELITQYLGAQIAVNAKGLDMYAAVKAAAKKLESALQHRKGALNASEKQKPAA